MKFYQLVLFVGFGALLAACAHDEERSFQAEIPLEIQIVDAGLTAGARATTDVNYVTKFEAGDRVGLYAVKEGVVVGGVENLPLSYTDAGTWAPAEPLQYNGLLDGATFYAYYPYAEESLFDAANADPFAGKIAAWTVAEDISTEELFAANDLMIGSSQALLENGRYSMTLELAHCLSMLVVELPSTQYTFTNSEPVLPSYTVAAVNPTFTVVAGETEQVVKPLYVAEQANYRMLVKAATPCSMVGRFEVSGKKQKYTITFAEGIAAGTYEPYVVDGGVSEKNMALKVGDYFCADGSIVAYEQGVAAPANAVGVVYQLGTTDGIKAAKPECAHAMVYALARTKRGTAEGVTDNTAYGDDAYLSIWSKQQAVSDDDALNWAYNNNLAVDSGKFRGNEKVANGYEMTTAWLSLPLINEKDVLQIMRATHAGAVAVPTGTTGWFIPSLFEAKQLNGLVDQLNPALEAAGGEKMWTGADNTVDKFIGYWTSTMRARNAVFGYITTADDSGDKVGYVTNTKGYYRFALAF